MTSTLAFALFASLLVATPATRADSPPPPKSGHVNFNCLTSAAPDKRPVRTRFKFTLNVQDPENIALVPSEVPFATGQPSPFYVDDNASPLRALNVQPEVELNRDFNLSIWANYYNNYFVTVTLDRVRSRLRSGTVLIEDGGYGIKDQEISVGCTVTWHSTKEELATLAAFAKMAKEPTATNTADGE